MSWKPSVSAPSTGDVSIAAGVAILFVFEAALEDTLSGAPAVASIIAMVTCVALMWRTRAPVGVLVTVLITQTIGAVPAGVLLPGAGIAGLTSVLIALGAVATRYRPRISLTALAVTYVLNLVATSVVWGAQGGYYSLVLTIACPLAWGLGFAAFLHNERIAALDCHRKQAASAALDERSRIVDELNAIVSRALETMTDRLAVARMSLGRDRDQTVAALAVIEETGITAMAELRRLLHVLRDDPTLTPPPPESAGGKGMTSSNSRLFESVTKADAAVTLGAIFLTLTLTVLAGSVENSIALLAYFGLTLSVLLWRNRYPVVVFMLIVGSLAGGVFAFRGGDFVHNGSISLVPILVALFAVAAGARPRASLAVLAIAIVYLAVPSRAYPEAFIENITASTVLCVAVWATGRFTGIRRRRIAESEKVQDMAWREIQLERSRLAFQLHDVVGHSVTAMILQAAGARRLIDREPLRVRTALDGIEEAGQDAATELNGLVSVLTDGANNLASGAPAEQRGLADADSLIERAERRIGRITRTVHGTPAPLDPSVDYAAFCVIREALDNAEKHADHNIGTEIIITWNATNVDITIANGVDENRSLLASGEAIAMTPLTGGYGLISLHERVAAVGGDIHWATNSARFAITASLPIRSVRN
jgi:signal transduction histidine kinase